MLILHYYQGRIEYRSAESASGDSEVESYFDGEWRAGQPHGYGIRRYASGDVYEGMWYRGQRHGHGSIRWLSRDEIYTGQWENGVQVLNSSILQYFTRLRSHSYHIHTTHVNVAHASSTAKANTCGSRAAQWRARRSTRCATTISGSSFAGSAPGKVSSITRAVRSTKATGSTT